MATTLDDIAVPVGFNELGPTDGLLVDLRYASADNFVGRNVYGTFDRLMLHAVAADKLRRAVALLGTERPDLRLKVWDGFRPNRVQRVFWATVKGTDRQKFVGEPAIGSVHGFGFAVDLTLTTLAGRDLDMGTGFDDFSALAEPRLEAAHLAAGALTPVQVDNRHLLRDLMGRAGFTGLPIEWWHFDALPADDVRARHRLIE